MMTTPQLTELGPWLSHYTTADAAFGKILPSGELRMSPYARIRDPFENKSLMLSMGFAGDPDEPERAWMEAMEQINRLRDDMRVLSLTRDAVELVGPGTELHSRCCWARPRMWEQYAENHAGVGLIFDRRELEAQLKNELRHVGPYYIGEVSYTPRGFYGSPAHHLSVGGEAFFDPATRPQAIADHIEKYHEDFFFLKTDDWATEYEYRCVLMQPAESFARVKFGGSLKFAVIGEKFPEWQIPAALAACSAAGIELKRMSWATGWPFPGRASP
jgi:hypothetical protein